jgi:hypothetical protein
MNLNNYHTREGYERLLIQIHKQTQSPLLVKLKHLSDYQLLTRINGELLNNGCLPMEHEELERELA